MDLYKQFDNIDYEKYIKWNKIGSCFYFLSIGTFVTSIVNGEAILLPLVFILEQIFEFFSSNELFLNVKEVKEIKILYQEFLERYHKLNKCFDLNNPIEIMALFTYLLNRGYLSKEHKHIFSKVAGDHSLLAGAYSFTGVSCCRHDGVLLSDILTKAGVKASVLFNYETFALPKDIKDFVALSLTALQNPNSYKATEELRDYNINLEKKLEEGVISDKDFHIIGHRLIDVNHLITIAEKDGISYFLDPTSDAVYRKRVLEGKDVLAYGVGISEPRVGFGFNKAYKAFDRDIKEVRKMLKGVNASLEEELEARRKINEITSSNQDIFEQFYRENAPLYEEVSQKLEKVRRKKS